MDINALVDKYGPTLVAAAQLQVQVAIQQDKIWVLFGAVICVILLALIVFLLITADYRGDNGFLAFILFMLMIVCGVFFIAGPLGEIWTYSANPQWGVVKEIGKLVK